MARRGKKVKIDLGELKKLCVMQATDEEVAAFFNISTRTIERRWKAKRFADIMARGRAKSRLSIRRMQIKLLEQGNCTMGVWLGKQILEQRDQIACETNGPQIFLICSSASSMAPGHSQLPPDEGGDAIEIGTVSGYLE